MERFNMLSELLFNHGLKIEENVIESLLYFEKENPSEPCKIIHKINKIFKANIRKNKRGSLNINVNNFKKSSSMMFNKS